MKEGMVMSEVWQQIIDEDKWGEDDEKN